MNLDEKALILLDSFDEIGYQKKNHILELFDKPKDLFNKTKFSSKREQILFILGEEGYSKLLKFSNVESADRVLDFYSKKQVNVITRLSKGYSELLLNIDSPPLVLYYRGDISLLSTFCIAVVGTRKPTSYGINVTEKFTKELVDYNITVVSGLAYGVDSVAHNITLDNNGKTIAVIAGGIDEIYPKTNLYLAKRIIANGGLIVSENRPGRKVESYMFPIRNRIIAGLSSGVIITEASLKSGTMHTKNYALDFQREVFAVPGSIFSESSLGTNRIISESNAKLVVNIDDVLDEFIYIKFKRREMAPSNQFYSNTEQQIIDLLKDKEMSFQEIVEKVNLKTSELNTLLTKLTLRGIIRKHAGNVYFLIK